MKSFFLYILILFISSITIAETIVRLCKLNSDEMSLIVPDKDGYKKIKSNSKGFYRFGYFPQFNESRFRINDIGFNSLLDYELLDLDKINIAIVGDSFVESFHVNIKNSIGSKLMDYDDNIQCFEFGRGGFTISDMFEVYNDYNLKEFEIVIFFISKDDLSGKTGKVKYNPKLDFLRDLYNRFKLFQFLNRNFQTSNSIKKLFNIRDAMVQKLESNKINQELIDYFNSLENVYMVSKFKNEEFFLNENFKDLIEVNHRLEPYNFGYDKHWNINGRENIFQSIITELKLE